MTTYSPDPKKKTLPLMVDLSDEELLKAGAQVSHARGLFERLTLRKKKATSAFNERIKRADLEIHNLSEQLRTKKRETLVDVEDRPDLFGGVMKTCRLDTGEVVSERKLTPDEKQLNLGQAAAMAGQGNGPVAKAIGLETARDNTKAAERARAEGDLDEAQTAAATPEEAEEIRLARQVESLEGDCTESVRVAVENLLIYNTKIVDMKTEADGATFYVAKVDAPGYVMEAEGLTRDSSRIALKAKLLLKYAANEEEIAKLAAEQEEDRKKNGPKNLLKAPKRKAKGPKVQIGDGPAMNAEEAEAAVDAMPPGVELCTEDCTMSHEHSDRRVPF